MVFALDLFVSVVASLMTLNIWNLFTSVDILEWKSMMTWIGSSFVASFFLMLILHTYRMIIRHSTIKDLGRLILLAFIKCERHRV